MEECVVVVRGQCIRVIEKIGCENENPEILFVNKNINRTFLHGLSNFMPKGPILKIKCKKVLFNICC